jgi:molybdopterin converting factor small subunit
MKVLFHGRLAEAIGSALEVNCASDCTVAEVRERVAAEHPDAASVLRNKRALSVVGEKLVRDDYRLTCGDKLEFLPPVSGG